MMKEQVRAVAVQHEPRPLTHREENLAFILETLAEQAAAGAELVVFPEVGITSFFRHEADGFRTYWNEGAIDPDGPELARVCAAAARHGLHVVVGFAERGDCVGKIYNSAALIGPEGLIGISRKIHMPGVEKLYFTPGERVETFDCALGRIGIAICYDTFFPEVTRQHFLQEADILVFSSSIWRGGAKGGAGLEGSKHTLWSGMATMAALQNQAFVVSSNGCGQLDLGAQVGTWERLGLSQIVTPAGEVLAAAGEREPAVIAATLRRAALVESRAAYRFHSDRRAV